MDYASRADFDLLRQQLHSDPTAQASLRSIPQALQRDYSGVLIPAAADWDTVWTFSGRGGVIFPDRELEIRLLLGHGNYSGRTLWYQRRVLINDEEVFTGNLFVQNNSEMRYTLDIRLIGTGSNTSEILVFGGNVLPLTIDLASPWTIGIQVRWRDAVGIDFDMDPDVFTLPADDTWVSRIHSVAILT